MADLPQILFFLKEILNHRDLVKFIMNIYIYFPQKAVAGELFFKCSCQQMTRIVDAYTAVSMLPTDEVIEYPGGKFSFYKERHVESPHYYPIPLKEVAKGDPRLDTCWITNCEYCDAFWIDDSEYVTINLDGTLKFQLRKFYLKPTLCWF